MWSNGAMRSALVGVLVALPLVAGAEVDVKTADGRVDLKATSAPLSEILDRLAKQTGMKVTYEGGPVRQPVTVTLLGRTPAEAVLGVLDGLGLNYALRMDLTGTRVDALMIAGTAGASGFPTPPATPTPAFRPPVAPAPEPEEEPEAEEEQQEPPPKPGAGVPPQPGQPPNPDPAAGAGPVGVSKPNMPTYPGPGVPTAGPMFPVSPFAPTAPTLPPPFLGNQPTPEQPAPAQPGADATDDESQ